MTIERSPAAATPSKASEAHTAKSKSKAGPSDGTPDASANGFLAILGALGDGSDGLANAGDGTAVAVDTSALPGTVLDANALLLQNPQIGAAMAGAAATDQVLDGNALAASLASANAVQGQVQVQVQGIAQAQEGKGVRPLRLDGGEAQGPGVVPKDALLGQESPTTGLQHVAGHAKSGKDSLPTATDAATSTANNAAPAAAAERKDAMDARLMAALEQVRNATAAKSPEPVATAALASHGEKSTSERAAGNAKGADPTYTGTSLGVSGPDFTQTLSATATATPDLQVAEQVTYWISQNVQNAEMKLDGLGQSPVEVSISVQGNEAQIAFRSDEAQTRGVLESAGLHLKDMLQREGMVLTGVSVGTSGSGDSGAGERRGRPPARQTVIAPLQPAAAPAAARAGAAAGRSVDLFV